MAKKRLFAMPLSDKATYIYWRLTDLDREIRTEYSDFVRKCVGSNAIFDKIFYQTFNFLGLSR